MRLVGRLLRLLFWLIYRLIMLVMFERWIPFPQRAAPTPMKSESREATRRPWSPASRAQPRRLITQHERAFFEAESLELSPERAAQSEGEHWQISKAQGKRALTPARRETLSGLLGDKRAVRDAVVLGAALGTKRDVFR